MAQRDSLTWDRVETEAAARGLALRGAFHPNQDDGVPDLPDGHPAATLVLLGNVGSSLWAALSAGPEIQDGQPDPINRWSERVVGDLVALFAAAGGAVAAHYPFGGPPYVPFLRWAQRAEPVFSSPLGMLIHPKYGVWHAYRGALAFAEPIDLPAVEAAESPCATCAERPCLSACPVGAFTGELYEVDACVDHIATPAGRDCMELGCRARRACPVGAEHLYLPAQARLHMTAFLTARQKARADNA